MNQQPSASQRVQTILSVLPWLGARNGADVSEICARFGTEPDTLLADLRSVFLNVEPEIGPDHMVEVDVEGDWVSVRLADYFHRPPRLDHQEALLLLAAGLAMRHEPGLGEVLGSAVAKLERSLGPGAAQALEVDLGAASPEVLRSLSDSVAKRRPVHIEYFTWGRDELGSRDVDPHALRSVEGRWYLSGWCHERQAPRHFRVDRISSVEAVGPDGAFDVPEVLGDPARPVVEGELVELRVPVADAGLVASHPLESVDAEGDVLVVRLRIQGDAWLDRLLLRLGGRTGATSVETGESLAGRLAETCRRMLERHGVARPGGAAPVRSSG